MPRIPVQKHRIVDAREINLRASVESGQPLAFYADYENSGEAESVRYVTQLGVISMTRRDKNPDRLYYSFFGGYSESSAFDEIRIRFGLDHDMRTIYSSIRTDPFMEQAVSALYGMRVTENMPWEATLCFLVSQFNNIKRIRGIIKNLINRFGKTIQAEGRIVHLFPSPEAVAKASIGELMQCGAGFRARYIKSTALAFYKNPEYSELRGMEYSELKERLMELDGVGDKVADCILLFGYAKLEAFPIDVWIKRIVENIYFEGAEKKPAEIHDFAHSKWGGYAGYAQQYLFWRGREMKTGVANDKKHR